MARTTLVMGLFNDTANAERALNTLLGAGVNRSDISVVASDAKSFGEFGIEKRSHAGDGAAIGAGVGGALGAVIAGFTAVGAVATGGVGLIAAGPVVAALVGAGAGAAAGGAVGGLIGLGIPEHEVKFYSERLNKGAVLLGARVPQENASPIKNILEEHGAERITTQACEDRADAAPAIPADDWAKASPLRRLFIEQLQDMYYAEHQLVEALEKLQENAADSELAQAFSDHREQTREHINRRARVFQLVGVKPEQKKCPAINGIVTESRELMKLDDSPQRDAALICAAQKAEHYEIGTYGCLRTYAQTLGLMEPAAILEQTLSEEWEADQKLTDLAERGINRDAAVGATRR